MWNTYFWLLGLLIVIFTFNPQSVHDSGVQPNHQRQGNNYHDEPHQSISLFHPILRPVIHAEVPALYLPNVRDKEIRDNKYQGEYPTTRNNNLKL